KELSLQFVLGYTPEEFAGTLADIAEGRIPVAPLVTGRVGVDGVPGAFEALARPDTHAEILIEPWRRADRRHARADRSRSARPGGRRRCPHPPGPRPAGSHPPPLPRVARA